MIVFKGEVSSKCKEFLLKEETKNSFISTLIACGIFIIPIICAAVFYNKIFFIFPYKSQRFVCQKDLLVQGTIEEFEAVFEGKIVRKK